jgi:hypothetical protein
LSTWPAGRDPPLQQISRAARLVHLPDVDRCAMAGDVEVRTSAQHLLDVLRDADSSH